MFLFVLILIILAIPTTPYIIVAVKRKKMIKKLFALARKCGFLARQLHSFPSFSRNGGKGYDLLFENRERAYAVKLWYASHPNGSLCIRRDGTVFETHDVPEFYSEGSESSKQLHTVKLRVPKTSINFKMSKSKEYKSILLIFPANKEIVQESKTGVKKVSVGDTLFEKTVCSPASFAQLLKETGRGESARAAASEQGGGALIGLSRDGLKK